MWSCRSCSLLGRAMGGVLQQQQPQHAVTAAAAAAAAFQQPCLQLERVLGFQAVRHKQSFPKRVREPAAIRERVLSDRTMRKAIAFQRQASEAAAAAALAGPASPPSPPAAAEAAAAARLEGQPASAVPAGTIRSPLSVAADPVMAPTTSTSSSSTPATNASSESSSSSTWTPDWLKRMMGRGSSQPSKASPLSSGPGSESKAAASAAESSAAGDGWEWLDQQRDMTLDDYAKSIANEPDADDFEAPPRPLKPFRGPFAFYNQAFDRARVKYYRFAQHVSFISTLRPEDKLMVKLDPDILFNDEKMRLLADVSQHDRSVVADTIQIYQLRAGSIRRLHGHRAAGHPMPATSDTAAIHKLSEQLEEEERAARRAEVLKARDVRSCQLRANAVLSPLNPNRICPQTKLRYGDCCGRPQQARARKDETSVPGATGAKPKRAQKTPKWVKQMHRRHAHAG